MTTMFTMNIKLTNRTDNAALKKIHQAVFDGSQRNSKPALCAFCYNHLIVIALLVFSFSFNVSADTLQDKPASIQSVAGVDDFNEQDKARQRQSIAEAVRKEKLKMKTDVRDLNNKKEQPARYSASMFFSVPF